MQWHLVNSHHNYCYFQRYVCCIHCWQLGRYNPQHYNSVGRMPLNQVCYYYVYRLLCKQQYLYKTTLTCIRTFSIVMSIKHTTQLSKANCFHLHLKHKECELIRPIVNWGNKPPRNLAKFLVTCLNTYSPCGDKRKQ